MANPKRLPFAGTPERNDCVITNIVVPDFLGSGTFVNADGTKAVDPADVVYGIIGVNSFINEKGEKVQNVIIKGHCYATVPIFGLTNGFIQLKSNLNLISILSDGSEYEITNGVLVKIY